MPRFVISALALLLCVVGAAAPVLAQPGRSPGPAPYVAPTRPAASEPSRPRTSWYGWQTLAVDAAALGGVLSLEEGGMKIGLGTMFFGAPLVHVANGRPREALVSLGLRGGGIFGGAALFGSLSKGDSWDELGGIILGGFAGFAVASFTDAVILSHKPARPPRFTPTLSVQPGGASVGFNLRF